MHDHNSLMTHERRALLGSFPMHESVNPAGITHSWHAAAYVMQYQLL